MNLEVDNIHVAANRQEGSVTISFADVDLVVRPDQARELAFALMDQAAKAEPESIGVMHRSQTS